MKINQLSDLKELKTLLITQSKSYIYNNNNNKDINNNNILMSFITFLNNNNILINDLIDIKNNINNYDNNDNVINVSKEIIIIVSNIIINIREHNYTYMLNNSNQIKNINTIINIVKSVELLETFSTESLITKELPIIINLGNFNDPHDLNEWNKAKGVKGKIHKGTDITKGAQFNKV